MADVAPRPPLFLEVPEVAFGPLHGRLLGGLAGPGQPAALLDAFREVCAERFGVRLFTLLRWDPAREAIQRVHSSDPERYPLNAWKPMGPTPWGERLLKRGHPVLCRDEAELRWAFPDADLLVSMDCVANMSAPLRYDGRVLGVVSISDRSGAYASEDSALFASLAQLLLPSLLRP